MDKCKTSQNSLLHFISLKWFNALGIYGEEAAHVELQITRLGMLFKKYQQKATIFDDVTKLSHKIPSGGFNENLHFFVIMKA